MMCNTLLVSLFGSMIAAMAAPTSLDANTLLQNGEEAQALNRYFKSLKAADPCHDGQVACLGSQTLAKCQGTAWNITLSQCSGSQNCFALPSVSSNGTSITCTSEKSAKGLIAATGAVGGILGHPANGSMDVFNPGSMQHGSNESIATSVAPITLVSDFTPFATPTSHKPCTDDVKSQPAPTTTQTSTSNESNNPPDGEQRVTVTMILIPSQTVMAPPETRTISPEEASAIVNSAAASPTATINRAFPASPAPASPLTTQGGSIGYGGRDPQLLYF